MSQLSYETGAVIFLDVLGTKNRTAFEQKFAIHKLFHDEVARNRERQEQAPHVIYKRELRSFSDCAYIIYTYKQGVKEQKKDDLNLLYICLFNTSLSILRILNEGFLVRGGATLGDCFVDELGFFGPAIECSFHLESKKAVYPRISLEREVGQSLYEWERSREMHEMMAAMFTEIPRLILKDEAGSYFLNVYYELEKCESLRIGEEDLSLECVKERVFNLIERDESGEEDQRVLEKLAWMRTYTENSKLLLNQDLGGGSHSIVLGR